MFHKEDIGGHEEEKAIKNVNAEQVNGVCESQVSIDSCSHAELKPASNVTDLACKFICQATSKLSTLENVNVMVQACGEIVNSIIDDLQCDFKRLRSAPLQSSSWDNFEQKIQ